MYSNKPSSECVYIVTAERFTNTVLDSEQKRGIYNICFKTICFFCRFKKKLTYRYFMTLYIPTTHISAKYLIYIRFMHLSIRI